MIFICFVHVYCVKAVMLWCWANLPPIFSRRVPRGPVSLNHTSNSSCNGLVHRDDVIIKLFHEVVMGGEMGVKAGLSDYVEVDDVLGY